MPPGDPVRGLDLGEALRPPRARQVVPRGLDQRLPQVLVAALVIAPLRSLSPLECSEGVRPTHAANERAFDWIEKRPSAVVPAGVAVQYVALWA